MLRFRPFCVFNPTDSGSSSVTAAGCVDGMGQVLRRLFPFNRGLFEDKVANIWYVEPAQTRCVHYHHTHARTKVHVILTLLVLCHVVTVRCSLNVVVKFRELYDTTTLLRISTVLTGESWLLWNNSSTEK